MSARDELADLLAENTAPEYVDGYGVMMAFSGDTDEFADIILAAGYAKPRTVTTVEELDALPDGSLIKFASGLGRTQKHSVSALTGGEVITDKRLTLPATLLYEPTA